MENKIFPYAEQEFGGTETMARGFIKSILPEMTNIHKYNCVIIPGYTPDMRTIGINGERYIFWIHNNMAQFVGNVLNMLTNKAVRQQTKSIIAVSEYERRVLINELNIEPERVVVIPNAIEMVTPKTHKFEDVQTVKIIHASAKYRGMDLLLKAVPLIKEDFELNIFNDFYPDLPHNFDMDGVNDPRVNFYGKTPRKMLYKFFAESHIHAYPSTYPETSCLTQMEALSAGCYSVHSNLGALPETSLGYGTMIPIEELTPEKYAEELSKAIRQIKQNGYNYTQQVKDIRNNFSWDKAKENWLAFDKTI